MPFTSCSFVSEQLEVTDIESGPLGMSLTIAEFTVDRIVLEVRYQTALLLWDRSGALWTDLGKKHPSIANRSARPEQTVFGIDRDLQLTVELEKAIIEADEPPANLQQFQAVADDFFQVLADTLQVKVFSRVGCRVIFFKRYKSKNEAADAVGASHHMRLPTGRHLDVDGRIVRTGFVFQMEDDTLGATVRLDSDGRRIEFRPPFGVKEVPAVDDIQHGVTLDVDWYSHRAVTVGAFRPSEWVNQTMHRIRRDVPAFLS
jgi:hypothetical protein